MQDYLLVRVGLNVGVERWFSHDFSTDGLAAGVPGRHEAQIVNSHSKESVEGLQAKQEEKPFRFSLTESIRERRERRRKKRLQKQLRRRLHETGEQVVAEIRHFLTELGRLVDDRYECRCVYSDAVRSCLVLPEDRGRNLDEMAYQKTDDGNAVDWESALLLPRLWQQYWQFPEFDAYLQTQWTEELLKNVGLHRYVVLGTCSSTAAVILRCAPRMKSLRWFLQEKDCGQEIQEFVEDFYGEYGLAATLQPLEGERAFSRLLLETVEPVCVLDFSRESRIPTGGLAKGSIWLDFCSVEEKARRITETREDIFYFSVKEIWKRAGKS